MLWHQVAHDSAPPTPPIHVELGFTSPNGCIPSGMKASRIHQGVLPWATYERNSGGIAHCCGCLKARTILLISLLYHTSRALSSSTCTFPGIGGIPGEQPRSLFLVSMSISGQGCSLFPLAIKMGQGSAKKHPCGHWGAKSAFPCLLCVTASSTFHPSGVQRLTL